MEIDASTQESFSLVLFSGTDDKLTAASTLIAGAAVMGKQVHVLLQYWALDAFRKGGFDKDRGVAAEAGPEGAELMRSSIGSGLQHWSETLRQAIEIGEVSIFACAQSMDVLRLDAGDLDEIVSGVEGVASFIEKSRGQVTFI